MANLDSSGKLARIFLECLRKPSLCNPHREMLEQKFQPQSPDCDVYMVTTLSSHVVRSKVATVAPERKRLYALEITDGNRALCGQRCSGMEGGRCRKMSRSTANVLCMNCSSSWNQIAPILSLFIDSFHKIITKRTGKCHNCPSNFKGVLKI